MKILKKTRSVCSECFLEIPATVFEKDRRVYMKKTCPEHGTSETLIEKDAWIYEKILGNLNNNRSSESLTITLTHDCNNSCSFCYLPERKTNEKTIDEIKKEISGFSGKLIRLSGGEPTLRNDLHEIIRFASHVGKETCLLTNGIILSNPEYVNELENAGLDFVHLSLNSLNRTMLRRIESDILELKKKAISNLEKTKIKILISFMIIRGENDSEIGDMIKYCLKDPFIKYLRIRSGVGIGRHGKEMRFFLSEILNIVSRFLGVDKKQLLLEQEVKTILERPLGNKISNLLPCSFDVSVYRKNNKPIIWSDGLNYIKFHKSRFKTLLVLCNILKKRKLMAIDVIAKKTFRKPNMNKLNINLRSWPDKHTLDLDIIDKYCPTKQSTKNSQTLPFCYSLIMNERDNNI